MLLHWQFDPILFSFGPLAIRWYGLLFVGAFFAGQALLVRMFRAEGAMPEDVDRLMLYALVGTIAGARLAHCLFYDPAYYLSHPLAMLQIWEGGLASHGGAIGLLLGLWLGHRRIRSRLSFLWLVDRVAIAAALGAVFVRVANFLNSEIVGVPTSGHWGVVFEAIDGLPRHPVQLYEAAGCLAVSAVLWAIYRRCGRRPQPGLLAGWFMVLVFSVRVAAEIFKTPQAAYEAGQLVTVGQWLSVPFVLLGLGLIRRARTRPAAAV